MFVLLARDETAPHLVGLWAAIRGGDLVIAAKRYADLVELARAEPSTRDYEKSAEAVECAVEMMGWQAGERP